MIIKKVNFLLLLLAIILVVISGCMPQMETVTPTLQQTETRTSTVFPSPAPTSTPHSLVTPISDVLPPGLFLGSVPDCEAPIFSPPETQFCDVRVFSLDGSVNKLLAKITYNGIAIDHSIYYEKRLIFAIGMMDEHGNGLPSVIDVLDLETGESYEVPTPKGEFCQVEDISPNGTQLVVTCQKVNDFTEVGILSVPDGNLITLLDHLGETYVRLDYRAPRWSPDGKWLFFYKVNIYAGGQNVEDLYVTDMSCISKPSTCQDVTRRLSLPRPEGDEYANTIAGWTPDSHLAWALYDRIEVYDVESELRIRTYQGDPGGGRIDQMAWSPDGKWVAIVQDNAARTLLISTRGNERIDLVPKVKNPFWISMP